jgi:signal transduction histidine kinase
VIKRIWIRIFALIALAVLPATLLQLKLQKDSLGVAYDLVDGTGVRETLDQYLALIKIEAQNNPANESALRQEFSKVVAVKRSLEAFFYAHSSIDKQLSSQALAIITVTLLISIFGSLWISKGIVEYVQTLMLEREKARSKLRDLDTLKNWQSIARMLVHELRAPLTPIKMISSDLEIKFQRLDHLGFEMYLSHAQKLLSEQVRSIEEMISSFTAFGRLPEPELEALGLGDQVKEFCEQYSGAFGPYVSLEYVDRSSNQRALLDKKLFRDLLFNLTKNASESNDLKTNISFEILIDHQLAICLVRNTGKPIPKDLSMKMFEPYVSSKAATNSVNMGLGLTICKKIALDHGGDLSLAHDGTQGPVVFKFEVPALAKGKHHGS